MSEDAHKPMFNLGAVLRETGIKADTLRAWERRYGLPTPERTSGGHRLYTQREIEMVKWLHARLDEGLRISRAVDLWRSFEVDGKDPLEELTYPTYVSVTTLPAGEGIGELRSAWVDACTSFDEGRAEGILNQTFALYPPETVCLDLLAASLAEIGEGWYTGDITVQQEHFASELATRRIESLISSSPPPTLAGGVLVLCPPGEGHTFGSLLITFLIRRSRREAIFLGPNIPVERIDEVIQAVDPKLVILTAQQLHTAASLCKMASHLAERERPTSYGGRVFNLIPELKDKIHGQFLGEHIRDVPLGVDRILRNPIELPAPESSTDETKLALANFLNRQAEIEVRVWQEISAKGASYDHIAITYGDLAVNIIAALELGDIAFIGREIDWNKGFLENRGFPDEILTDYLVAYAEATKDLVGIEGKIITDYILEVIAGERAVSS
jgi:DNA-binding transcriptional MerR regulator